LSMKFSRVWPIFIWSARTYIALWTRVASNEDPTILYCKRLLVNVLRCVLQCWYGRELYWL
jgi:hypothetical protein